MRDKPLILIAEDDDQLRRLFARILARSGYEVVEARDGKQAVELAVARPPDLVVLDVGMPQLDGIGALRQMRSRAALRQTPVMMLSGLSQRGNVVQAAHAGAIDFFVKGNFNLKHFLAAVRDVLAETTVLPDSASRPAVSGQWTATTPAIPAMPAKGQHDAPEVTAGHGKEPASMPATAPAGGPAVLTWACDLHGACQLPELADHIPPLAPGMLDEYVEKIASLKVLPFVLPQVMVLTASQHSSGDQLIAAIEQDAALTAKVLAVANSSLYCRDREAVTNLRTAVRNIGFGSVRQAALSLGMVEMFDRKHDRLGLDRLRFWEHSFASACIARTLSQRAKMDESLAFLVGLLHSFGRLIQDEFLTNHLTQFTAFHDSDRPLPADLEQRWMGLDHTQLAKAVMRKWQIPPEVYEPIGNHRLSMTALLDLPGHQRRWAALVLLSDQLATCLGFGDPSILQLRHMDNELVDDFGVDDALLEGLRDGLPEMIRDIKMTMLAYAPSMRFPSPGIAVSDQPMLYFRPRAVHLDAIELFLRLRHRRVTCLTDADAFTASATDAGAVGRVVVNLLPSPRLERAIGQLDAWAAHRPVADGPAGVVLIRPDQVEQLTGPFGQAFGGILAPLPVGQLLRHLGPWAATAECLPATR